MCTRILIASLLIMAKLNVIKLYRKKNASKMILSESSRVQNFIISMLLVMEWGDVQMHKKGRNYLPIFLMVIAGW